MKVLIIEDSQVKAAALTRCVHECERGVEVIHATNARDGFQSISAQNVELCLLDVLLPLTMGDQPSEDGSLWFVREVQRKIAHLPLIVGTTQYLDSLAKVEETFRDYLWSVIYVAESETRWRRQISYAVRFAGSAAVGAKLSTAAPGADAAIITALRIPEFEEVMDALGGGDPLNVVETGENWVRRSLEIGGGRRVELLAACADEMGMCPMATLVTRLCIICKPKKLILTGIMGGNPARVGMSDLVLIEETWDCRAGKITERGFEADVKVQRCDFKLANAARSIVTDGLLLDLWKEWKGEKPHELPRLHVGSVACSPAVVANGEVFKELEAQKRKVLGVEMEAYGCYDGVHRLGDFAPRAICLKSVCDLGNKEKADKYQRYCSYLSAHVTMRLVKDDRFLDA